MRHLLRCGLLFYHLARYKRFDIFIDQQDAGCAQTSCKTAHEKVNVNGVGRLHVYFGIHDEHRSICCTCIVQHIKLSMF